jgi:hypothetical protein
VTENAVIRLVKQNILSLEVLGQQSPKTLSLIGVKVSDIVILRGMTELPQN